MPDNISQLPPHSPEMEQAVLSELLLDNTAMSKVGNLLHEDCFYSEVNKWVFRAIISVHGKGITPDMMIVNQELKALGLEVDFLYLAKLTENVLSGENVEVHATMLVEQYIRRSLIVDLTNAANDAYKQEVDILGLLSTAQNSLANVSGSFAGQKELNTKQAILHELEEIEARMINETPFSGVDTCSDHLNRKFGGLQAGSMYVMAARPGMLKTGVCLDMIRKMAVHQKTPCAFFSLEMPANQIICRWLGQLSKVPYGSIQKHKLTIDQYSKVESAAAVLAEAPLYIDDTSGITVEYLRSKLYKWKIEHGIKVAVVDYLQLMTGGSAVKSGQREQEIAHISRNLKRIAKDLDIAIIAIAQLSRAVESRGGDKRPQLSDLRESGAIEQDADSVIFLLRPSYYGITEDEMGNDVSTLLEMIVAKNRAGGLGSIMFDCDPATSTYEDKVILDF